MDFDCGLYAITNVINDKIYIGQSHSLNDRWKKHRTLLRGGRHHCLPLQMAWASYGESAFSFCRIAFVPVSDLSIREQEQIDSFIIAGERDKLYNVVLQVDAPMRGRTLSAESRRKVSESKKGKTFFSEAARKRMSDSQRGKKHSEESKAKIKAAARRGELSNLFGRVVSEELRAHFSEKYKGGNSPLSKRVICIETGKIFLSTTEAAEFLRANGLSAHHQTISACCRGEQKTASGYHWKYHNEIANKETGNQLILDLS